MRKTCNGAAVRQIESLWDVGATVGRTDGELLGRFVGRARDAAEPAFAALVKIHGPMVLRVCRSVARNEQDAEDAFQATFLVLARKADSLRVRDSLEPWLYGVAHRVASQARAAAVRRRVHEQNAALSSTAAADESEPGRHDELGALIREEIDRLPEIYRITVRLCAVEGLTCEQTARQLDWPPGTVRSRLARGKQRLRFRLNRRGLSPSVGVFASAKGQAIVPASLAHRTTRLAVLIAAGGEEAGLISVAVSSLTKGACEAMSLTRLKAATAMVLGLLVVGAVRVTAQIPADPPVRPSAQAVVSPRLKGSRARLELNGRTDFDPDTITKVRTAFGARVTQVYKTTGQMVKKGDPLVELYSTTMAAAWADFRSKSAQWDHDRSVMEMRRPLVATNQVPQAVWADTQLAEQTSRVNYLAAKDKLITYGISAETIGRPIEGKVDDLAKLTLRAATEGIIVKRDVVAGNFYEAADVLMEIARLDHLWIWADVHKSDRDAVRIGQAAEVRSPSAARAIRGTVDYVGEEVSEVTQSVRVRIVVPYLDGELKPGMLVRVTIDPAS